MAAGLHTCFLVEEFESFEKRLTKSEGTFFSRLGDSRLFLYYQKFHSHIQCLFLKLQKMAVDEWLHILQLLDLHATNPCPLFRFLCLWCFKFFLSDFFSCMQLLMHLMLSLIWYLGHACVDAVNMRPCRLLIRLYIGSAVPYSASVQKLLRYLDTCFQTEAQNGLFLPLPASLYRLCACVFCRV